MAINISAWSIRHPLPAMVMFAAIVAIGFLSFSKLPITQLPNADIPVVSVTITQFGAAPAELETQVTKTIEDAVSGVEGVKHIISSITDGISTTTIHFRLETNTDRALNDIKDAVTRVRANLPRTIDEPMIQRVDIAGLPILTYAAISPGKTPEQLSWFVEDVVIRALQGVRGVGRVELHRCGPARDPRRPRPDPAAGASASPRSMSAGSCAAAMSISPAAAPRSAGASRRSARSPAPRPSSTSRRPRSRCRAAARSGSTISASSPTRSPSRARSRASTARRSSASASCAPRARATWWWRTRSPRRSTPSRPRIPDVELKLIDSSVGYTLGNYHSALHTLYEGAALAVLVVFLFLRDLRATVIAAITLPLSILPAFWVMDVLGFSLNMVSLLAITLSHRHSGRRRDRRDREHRTPYPHGQIALSGRASRRPTRSASRSSPSA